MLRMFAWLPRRTRALMLGAAVLPLAIFAGMAAIPSMGLPGLGPWAPNTASGQGAVLTIDAPSSVPAGGGEFEVRIEIEGAQNLGAYEWWIRYDRNVVELTQPPESAISDGGFLGSTGRTVSCLPPILPPSQGLEPGNVRFGCNSAGAAPGVNGNGLLSTIRFVPVAGGSPNIQFVCAGLADPLGDGIPISNVPPCVAPITPTPTTPWPTASPLPTATPTPVVTPSPTPSPFSHIIPAGASSVTVLDDEVTARAQVMVTLTSDPRRSICWFGRCFAFGASPAVSWIELNPGEGFVVHLTAPVGQDTTFMYGMVYHGPFPWDAATR